MKLNEIVGIITGKTPPTRITEYFGEKYPFITPSDIPSYHERTIKNIERCLSDKGHNYQKNLAIPKNSTCFVAIGSTVGKMCLSSETAFTNQQIHSLIAKKSKVNEFYLFYHLRYIYPWIKSIADARGSGKPIINKSDFGKIPIEIPPLPIQKKIAAVLSSYDDLIENNNRRIAVLEKMAEEIYREWFVRMRFPGHERATFKKGVPVGWGIVRIKELCAEKRDSIKLKNIKNSTKYIGLEHLPRKSIAIKENSTIESVQSDKLLFKKSDILFCKIRPYLHKVALAHFSGACSTDTIVIRPYERNYKGLILFTVYSNTFIELATASAKGTKMPRADWDYLKNLEILLPSEGILSMFQKHFNSCFSLICKHLNENDILRQSRNLLLARLISGKLSVEDLDIKLPKSMEDAGA